MYTKLEHIPNEIFLDIFEYLDTRDLFHGFWNLNQRLNQLLQSLENLSLTIEKDESKLISLFGSKIKRLVVDTCLNIDFTQFPHLNSLILYDLTNNQLDKIQSKFMPNLIRLSISKDISSYTAPSLIRRIFSQELSSLHYVNLSFLPPLGSKWSKSYFLRSIFVYCTSPSIIQYILASTPNLSTLHVCFEEAHYCIFASPPSIVNHPLKYFKLSDPYSVLNFSHISTFLTLMPNLQKIRLNFYCDVPFIHLVQTISSQLFYLRQFDCHIDNAPSDDITSIELIRQIHPCFNRIQCITDKYGYQIYTTN